jgi:hypothetical protein
MCNMLMKGVSIPLVRWQLSSSSCIESNCRTFSNLKKYPLEVAVTQTQRLKQHGLTRGYEAWPRFAHHSSFHADVTCITCRDNKLTSQVLIAFELQCLTLNALIRCWLLLLQNACIAFELHQCILESCKRHPIVSFLLSLCTPADDSFVMVPSSYMLRLILCQEALTIDLGTESNC